MFSNIENYNLKDEKNKQLWDKAIEFAKNKKLDHIWIGYYIYKTYDADRVGLFPGDYEREQFSHPLIFIWDGGNYSFGGGSLELGSFGPIPLKVRTFSGTYWRDSYFPPVLKQGRFFTFSGSSLIWGNTWEEVNPEEITFKDMFDADEAAAYIVSKMEYVNEYKRVLKEYINAGFSEKRSLKRMKEILEAYNMASRKEVLSWYNYQRNYNYESICVYTRGPIKCTYSEDALIVANKIIESAPRGTVYSTAWV